MESRRIKWQFVIKKTYVGSCRILFKIYRRKAHSNIEPHEGALGFPSLQQSHSPGACEGLILLSGLLCYL